MPDNALPGRLLRPFLPLAAAASFPASGFAQKKNWKFFSPRGNQQ
jgi:hypothetical protein